MPLESLTDLLSEHDKLRSRPETRSLQPIHDKSDQLDSVVVCFPTPSALDQSAYVTHRATAAVSEAPQQLLLARLQASSSEKVGYLAYHRP